MRRLLLLIFIFAICENAPTRARNKGGNDDGPPNKKSQNEAEDTHNPEENLERKCYFGQLRSNPLEKNPRLSIAKTRSSCSRNLRRYKLLRLILVDAKFTFALQHNIVGR
jgi:hypothetical protein